MDIITKVNQKELKTDLPQLRPGQTVQVHQRITEAGKERIQVFEGIIIALHGGRGMDGTMTVRKVSFGVGVEKIFPLHSPSIKKIEIVKETKVRRAKLYYLRNPKKTKKFSSGKREKAPKKKSSVKREGK